MPTFLTYDPVFRFSVTCRGNYAQFSLCYFGVALLLKFSTSPASSCKQLLASSLIRDVLISYLASNRSLWPTLTQACHT